MSATYEIIGFDDIFEELKRMEISESRKRSALNNAGDILEEGIKPNLPRKSGKYQETTEKQIKRLDEGLSVIVKSKAWWDIFQEYGTSKQKKNIGSFEKGVNQSADKAVQAIIKELSK